MSESFGSLFFMRRQRTTKLSKPDFSHTIKDLATVWLEFISQPGRYSVSMGANNESPHKLFQWIESKNQWSVTQGFSPDISECGYFARLRHLSFCQLG